MVEMTLHQMSAEDAARLKGQVEHKVFPTGDHPAVIDAVVAAIAGSEQVDRGPWPETAAGDARVGLLLAHHAVREAIGGVLHAHPRDLSAAAEALAAAQTQLDIAVERASAALAAAAGQRPSGQGGGR